MTCRILGSKFDTIQLLFGYHRGLMQALNSYTFWIRYGITFRPAFSQDGTSVFSYSERDRIRTFLRRNEI